MSRHHEDILLRHLQEAIEKAVTWSAGISKAEFMDDELVQSAVIRQLEIAGEAAGRLSDEFRASHPEIEARRLKGLRNVLIHGYAAVDLETVWEVVTHDLPELQRHWPRP